MIATPFPPSDTITIAVAPGRFLAKRFHADGRVSSYDLVRFFDLYTANVAGLSDLLCILQQLQGRWSACVLRGEITDQTRTRGVRRLSHADRDTGEAATLREVPRLWLSLDVERLMPPPGLQFTDLHGCGAFARAQLPLEFRSARCIVVATASHGVKPDIRLRIWFWLDRPLCGAEVKRWLRICNFVDPCIFQPAQPTYTAGPIFLPPLSDPLPVRLVELPGTESVPVPPPEALAPPPRPSPSAVRSSVPNRRYAFAALRNAVGRIATAAEGKRHQALVREAAGIGRLVNDGIISETEAREALTAAAEVAGMEDGTEIERAISWGLKVAEVPSP